MEVFLFLGQPPESKIPAGALCVAPATETDLAVELT